MCKSWDSADLHCAVCVRMPLSFGGIECIFADLDGVTHSICCESFVFALRQGGRRTEIKFFLKSVAKLL